MIANPSIRKKSPQCVGMRVKQYGPWQKVSLLISSFLTGSPLSPDDQDSAENQKDRADRRRSGIGKNFEPENDIKTHAD